MRRDIIVEVNDQTVTLHTTREERISKIRRLEFGPASQATVLASFPAKQAQVSRRDLHRYLHNVNIYFRECAGHPAKELADALEKIEGVSYGYIEPLSVTFTVGKAYDTYQIIATVLPTVTKVLYPPNRRAGRHVTQLAVTARRKTEAAPDENFFIDAAVIQLDCLSRQKLFPANHVWSTNEVRDLFQARLLA